VLVLFLSQFECSTVLVDIAAGYFRPGKG